MCCGGGGDGLVGGGRGAAEGVGMELEIGGVSVAGHPDEAAIIAAIRGLEMGQGEFAILSRDDAHYIQTVPGPMPGSGFALEYQDGSVDQHYNCTDTYLGVDDIMRAFIFYLQGDD